MLCRLGQPSNVSSSIGASLISPVLSHIGLLQVQGGITLPKEALLTWCLSATTDVPDLCAGPPGEASACLRSSRSPQQHAERCTPTCLPTRSVAVCRSVLPASETMAVPCPAEGTCSARPMRLTMGDTPHCACRNGTSGCLQHRLDTQHSGGPRCCTCRDWGRLLLAGAGCQQALWCGTGAAAPADGWGMAPLGTAIPTAA